MAKTQQFYESSKSRWTERWNSAFQEASQRPESCKVDGQVHMQSMTQQGAILQVTCTQSLELRWHLRACLFLKRNTLRESKLSMKETVWQQRQSLQVCQLQGNQPDLDA